MIAKLRETRERVRERIRVREIALPHRLQRMRRLRILLEQESWKIECGFDRIEIIAEMHAPDLDTSTYGF